MTNATRTLCLSTCLGALAIGGACGQDDGQVVDTRSDVDSEAVVCPAVTPEVVTDVSVEALHERLSSESPTLLLDVREPSETASGIVEGARLLPWGSGVLSRQHDDLPAGLPIFIICQSGVRGAAAANFLVETGRTCVHNVTGGMSAWLAAGYPTVSPP